MFIRHRFQSSSVDDYRPIKFPTPGPWWCSGYGGGDNNEYAIIVAYLPEGFEVTEFWPEAENIEEVGRSEQPVFSDRFPKPDWWKD